MPHADGTNGPTDRACRYLKVALTLGREDRCKFKIDADPDRFPDYNNCRYTLNSDEHTQEIANKMLREVLEKLVGDYPCESVKFEVKERSIVGLTQSDNKKLHDRTASVVHLEIRIKCIPKSHTSFGTLRAFLTRINAEYLAPNAVAMELTKGSKTLVQVAPGLITELSHFRDFLTYEEVADPPMG